MTIHAVWVINKAGGLVFSRTYSDTLPTQTLNATLILAGTLHGIHAITSRLNPITGKGGLESFEGENWGGKIWMSLTGIKFVVLHSIAHQGLDELMRKIYEIYSDAVMKNPFQTLEMPINSSLFESRLLGLIQSVN
ncbi:hypothetical protein TREMEDRAFT_31800 [Tremella mesenterica DSM 1558]|uniref:uncharacterized protein n=1 Tax=Tremella mesenterica (strain ATCC 24925 / CBS 8224 / DSM 1558 / NBRC 9311 / NRRL Y-6157 / RJB 2259-6 / UBC 559-6) TaxID=578456 RepID=UPI0003F4A323|nr:uncharacterized protein TREMEDRAFT_31800 [Tremella mesenterica DSM 1558]EIW68810.1 hypothetical protein TREMEDRAFT_31800 [Tremella mesenterica DSM 1558]